MVQNLLQVLQNSLNRRSAKTPFRWSAILYEVMVAPEAPHSHPSHTGHRWLDIVLGLSAMFVSVVSLVVAVEHGRTMERMADANTRMVDANSWPFVEFDSHNADEKGNP